MQFEQFLWGFSTSRIVRNYFAEILCLERLGEVFLFENTKVIGSL